MWWRKSKKSESDADREQRYQDTFQKEKRLIEFSAFGFVTCTELGMNIDDWFRYSKWKEAKGLNVRK